MSASAPLFTGKNRRRALRALIAGPILALGIAAAGMLAVVVVPGLSSAAEASETSYTNLCVIDGASVVCAYAQGSGNTILMLPKSGTVGNTTNWYWPNTNTDGVIKQAASNLCMQLNEAGGDTVREAKCPSGMIPTYDLWYLTPSGQFESEWNDQCLTYNKDKAILDTVDCNGAWYQHWYGLNT